MLVGQGWVSPLDFWKLPPGQVWWIIEAHNPTPAQPENTGEIVQLFKAAKAKEVANG